MNSDPQAIFFEDIDLIRLGQSFRAVGITMEAARADPELIDRLMYDFDEEITDALMADWHFLARPEQLPPCEDAKFWLYIAGRGSGKTRTGAEWTKDLIRQGYNRGGLIAPTAADARDVMVEGESGLLAVCNAWDCDYNGNPMGRPLYEPSKRRVTWENGAMVTLYSADEPDRLRGPQHAFLWMDELAAWRQMETFDMAMFGLRLGKKTKVFVSTTPKPKPLIRSLVARARDPDDAAVVMTTGSSERNVANLAPGVIEELRDRYGSTEIGRQELDGELLEDLESAFWSRTALNKLRSRVMPGLLDSTFYFTRIVIGVDPATTNKVGSDETGIVVAALGNDGHGYVLADYSGKYSPANWGDRVANAAKLWQADEIIAEVNQGGEMVEFVLKAADPNLRVKMVTASRGKMARAEPVAQKYEQGKVHHVGIAVMQPGGSKNDGHLDDLEDQMCSWDRYDSKYSPDRIDALVWALTDLMVDADSPIVTGRLRGGF